MFDATYFRGRVGLFAILKALKVGPGDEVALQSFTCSAVPEAILATGALPKYIDVAERSVNMCMASLRERITSNTRAIIIQHTFGIPAEMEGLNKVATEYGIPVIEDCCHSYQSSYAGRRVGEFGVAAFYSFEWGKPVVVGVGGAVKANDKNLQCYLKHRERDFIRPSLSSTIKIEIQYAAFRILYSPTHYWVLRRLFRRLSASGAAVGNYNPLGSEPSDDFGLTMADCHRRRLERLMPDLTRRNVQVESNMTTWLDLLRHASAATLVHVPERARVVYVRIPLWVEDKVDLLASAERQSLEIADWYSTPVHPLDSNALSQVKYEVGACPRAEWACKSIVSLPVHARLSSRYVDAIGQLLR